MPDFKYLFLLAGRLCGVGGVIFVVLKLREYTVTSRLPELNDINLWGVCGLILFYSLANVMLSVAWRDLLWHFHIRVPLKPSIRIYGLSQLAKYVPGNIIHLASRQALGRNAGIPHKVLLKTAIYEMLFITLAGAVFAALLITPLLSTDYPAAGVILFLLLTGITAVVLGVYRDLYLARAYMGYMALLGITGFTFFATLPLVGTDIAWNYDPFFITGAYVLAWLAGFLVPGSPAGLGIREIALFTLLAGAADESLLLVAISLGRVITVLSDLLFYLVSLFIPETPMMQESYS